MTRFFTAGAACLLLFSGAGCETIMYGVTGMAGSAEAETAPTAAVALLTNPGGATSDLAAALPCPDDRGCLSALVFNMRHRDVPVQLEALARSLESDVPRLPDFILCQEVVFGRPARKGRDNTAAIVADRLGYHVRGTPRRDGMEGVSILSRHSFDHYEHLHLGARDGFFSGGFPRVSVMGEFTVPQVGRVRVVNVHLAHRRSRHEIRRDQLRETLAWIAQREAEAPADVTLLGGDFNTEPDWDELALVGDAQATGGLDYQDHNSRVVTSGRAGRPYRRVDYVFVAAPRRSVESVGEAVLWPNGLPTVDGSARFWISDHMPLLHVFSIGPAG